MRYLIVAADVAPCGGMDRAIHAVANHLARRDAGGGGGGRDEVHLVAHRAADDLLACPNVTFHRVPKPANSYFLGEPLLDRAGRRRAAEISDAGGRVIVNGGNCQWGDVNWVHYVHAAYTPAVAGGALRRLKGRWSHRVFLARERDALTRARVVIANSHRTKRDLVGRLGLRPERVHVIYYGTEPGAFRPATAEERRATRAELNWPAERPVVAFVGALGDRRKGFDTLFAAWAELCKDGAWDADLVAIGTGAELPAWRARVAADDRLAPRVKFLGYRTDVQRLLGACDALVAPTRYEAYGLGVQEALCCGLPALVSADAGVAEQYPPELAGLLLPDPDDAADLARRLRAWRDRREDCARQARTLGERLRHYTWDDMARRVTDLIQHN